MEWRGTVPSGKASLIYYFPAPGWRGINTTAPLRAVLEAQAAHASSFTINGSDPLRLGLPATALTGSLVVKHT